mgnify:CR=1 FL=1
MTLLSVKNLRVTFNTEAGIVEAVRGVSFSLGRERLGIVGESGSGKTTLMRAIFGLQPLSAGSINVAGSISRPRYSLRENAAFVAQSVLHDASGCRIVRNNFAD